MAAFVREIDELLYGLDKEEIREFLRQGANAILEVVLNKLAAEGTDKQEFLDAFNASEKNHKDSVGRQERQQNTVHTTTSTTSHDVQSPVKNVKQKEIYKALESTNDVEMKPPSRKTVLRAKKIKTEPPDEPHQATRSRNVRNQTSNKESVIVQVPDIPLIDLTNNSVSPRRIRSRVRKTFTHTQVYETNNVSKTEKHNNMTDHKEVLTKSKLQLNSPDKEVTKDKQQVRANLTIKTKELNPNEKSPNDKLSQDNADLNQTYTLPLEPQTTNMPVPIKLLPKESDTPTKPNKLLTPLKNSKTHISKLPLKSPNSSSTPLGTFKAQKVLKAEEKQKGQESLRKKEALEKNKKKDIERQREHEMKKKAQIKKEAVRKIIEKKNPEEYLKKEEEKKKAEEYLKKKQEEKMKANPADGPSEKVKKNLIYMTKDTPLLPTVDCYDSDEEHEQQHPPQYATWTQSKFLEREELVGSTTGRDRIHALFMMKVVTPDLRQLFESIDDEKLVRSSSAHWKRPARYTLFEQHSHIYFSEDESI